MNKLRLVRSYYERSKLIKKLKSLNAPSAITNNTIRKNNEAKKEMDDCGITEEEIDRIIDDHWMEWESIELHEECQNRCLHSLRELQEKSHLQEIIPIECPGGNTPCCSCPHFLQATEEQMLRYYHNQDIDTGENLPDIPGIDDE